MRASFECDSDGLRKTFDHLAVDKSEEKNAVYNLMHQAGMYETQPADGSQVTQFAQDAKERLQALGGPHHATARERGAARDQRSPRM